MNGMMYIYIYTSYNGRPENGELFQHIICNLLGSRKNGSTQVGQSFEAWAPSDDIGLVVSVSQNTELENVFPPSLHHEMAGEDNKQFERIFYHHLEPPSFSATGDPNREAGKEQR